jgi:sporulation protein YlmC with PRC-barrel domain
VGIFTVVDEGLPIAYPLLEAGVPIYARTGEEIGKVEHVVAAQEEDIFHGLVISTARLGRRFVPAEDIAALHERGVDLRIGMEEVAELPPPSGAAPVYSGDAATTRWEHWARRLSGRGDWRKR